MRHTYSLQADRQIYRDGKPFISIGREGGTAPTDADTMAHVVRHLLTLLDSAHAHIGEDRAFIAFTVQQLSKAIKASGLSFKGIAFRGLSGSLVGPMLCAATKSKIIAVRKDERRHSSYSVEGGLVGGNYIIVDDLIDSGGTIREIQNTLDSYHETCKLVYDDFPPFTLVGIFLYDCIRSSSPTPFRAFCADRAGLDNVPVYTMDTNKLWQDHLLAKK